MTARILQGDVFDRLPEIAPGSVDCVVTSPPYWALRSYLPAGHPQKARELGSEPTPSAYVEAMVRVFRLVRECMAPHATAWVNCGDSYSDGGTGANSRQRNSPNANWSGARDNKAQRGTLPTANPGIPAGNLCLIPQRLAIALQDDGWIVRSVIVFHKPAPMPGSMSGWAWKRCRVKVKGQEVPRCDERTRGRPVLPIHGSKSDKHHLLAQWTPCPGCKRCEKTGGLVLRRGSWRPTSSYEPVLLLAKSPRYFSDGEAVRKIAEADDAKLSAQGYLFPGMEGDAPPAPKYKPRQFGRKDAGAHGREELTGNMAEGVLWHDTGGANLRDVWTIPAEPLSCGLCPACGLFLQKAPKYCPRCGEELGKHYASFSTELVYRCLAAGTSQRGYCPACSAPWARVVETESRQEQAEWTGSGRANGCMVGGGHEGRTGQWSAESKTLGWRPTCSHDLPPRPGLVLDPFAGSARVGLQAQRMGLDFVGVELSEEYCRLGRRLLTDAAPLFAEEG